MTHPPDDARTTELDFAKGGGLVPAVVQDAASGRVLMLGYMDEAALAETRRAGLVTFFSRSKGRLWTKGETSGDALEVVSVHVDCDADAILVLAHPRGPTCHRGTTSCFDAPASPEGAGAPPPSPPPPAPVPDVAFLAELDALVRRRRDRPQDEPASYTAKLFAKGLPTIARKVGEEAVEAVVEALGGEADALAGEAADVLYHLLVLLAARDVPLARVVDVLRARHRTIAAGVRRG